MGIGQHARSQVGELRLGSVVVCEDMAQRAAPGGANQRAALAGV